MEVYNYEMARATWRDLNVSSWLKYTPHEYVLWIDEIMNQISAGWCKTEFVDKEDAPHARIVVPKQIALNLTKEDYDFYVNELMQKEKAFKMKRKLKNLEKDFQ